MHFTKMQGLGNDYLYVYGEVPAGVEDMCRKLSDRHFGAGSDGMIFITPSYRADFMMRIFNADGSEAMMCGNGIRCVGKYLYDRGYTDKTRITVDTLSGIKTLEMSVIGGKVRHVTVSMGTVSVSHDIPLILRGMEFICTPVSVGNPHAVIFIEDTESIPVSDLGPLVEHNILFPGGVNAEFVTVTGENELRMRVWERGSGITLACGTGACASVTAAVTKGIFSYGIPISVDADGGRLEVTVLRNHEVLMTGPAETVFEGETDLF